jgi:biopolymer transport protein ExbD
MTYLYYTTMRKPKTQFYIPIDLAAVCSVAFVLLLLYLSMAREKPEEPVEINLPETSGFRCSIDGFGEAIILLGQDKVFLQLADTLRKDALIQIGLKYNIPFKKQYINRFRNIVYIGLPADGFNQDIIASNQPGISLQEHSNELGAWINAANKAYHTIYQRDIRVAIKADKNTAYPIIKNVISTLQDQGINRFSFITATKISSYD